MGKEGPGLQATGKAPVNTLPEDRSRNIQRGLQGEQIEFPGNVEDRTIRARHCIQVSPVFAVAAVGGCDPDPSCCGTNTSLFHLSFMEAEAA
jgi:hypothetical protein